jgi:hypothetical protein
MALGIDAVANGCGHDLRVTGYAAMAYGNLFSKPISRHDSKRLLGPEARTWLVPVSYVSRTCLVQGGSSLTAEMAVFRRLSPPSGSPAISVAYFTLPPGAASGRSRAGEAISLWGDALSKRHSPFRIGYGAGYPFGIRASGFFRPSAFGFRTSPSPPPVRPLDKIGELDLWPQTARLVGG